MCNFCGCTHQYSAVSVNATGATATADATAGPLFGLGILTGTNHIDSFILGHTWTGGNGSASKTLEYTITARDDDGDVTNSPLDINPAFKTAVGNALQAWANVANVSFEYKAPSMLNTASNSSHDIIFDETSLSFGTLGSATPTLQNSTKIIQENIKISESAFNDVDYGTGGLGYLTLLHEIGHGLGLAHPDDITNAGVSVFDIHLPNAEENVDASVMISILPTPGTHASGARMPTGPQIYDIAAIQYLYGANHGYQSGNDTYTFSGASQAHTIWDGGGIDTISQAGMVNDLILDIREGLNNVSLIAEARVWNAIGANIENAHGGIGKDTIYGNTLGNGLTGSSGDDTINGHQGNDTVLGNQGNDFVRGGRDSDLIRGGKGDDTIWGDRDNDIIYGDKGSDIMHGGHGNDIFVFESGSGLDFINDFEELGSGGGDQVHISSAIYGSVAEVLANTTYNGGNAHIALGVGGENITLLGVSLLQTGDIAIV